MSVNLMEASRQWATRPPDQRFADIPAMANHCAYLHEGSIEAEVTLGSLRIAPDKDGNDLEVIGQKGLPAHFTNWSFTQLSGLAKAPAGYLSSLPARLAADCLNEGLQANAGHRTSLLLHKNGGMSLRAATGTGYNRIWNDDVIIRLSKLQDLGWQVPPARPAFPDQPGTRPATAADMLAGNKFGLSIKVGDAIAPAGLYAGDRDMFAFMVDETKRINDGTPGGLSRGFFVSNSEVGDCAFRITSFLYKHVCGNHIVWDASQVKEVRIRHVGRADARAFSEISVELKKYGEASAADDEGRILASQRLVLGDNKDAILDRLFGLKIAPRIHLDAAWRMGVEHEDTDGAPDTAWGFAQGLTRHSQTMPNAGARAVLDAAAGRVLALSN